MDCFKKLMQEITKVVKEHPYAAAVTALTGTAVYVWYRVTRGQDDHDPQSRQVTQEQNGSQNRQQQSQQSVTPQQQQQQQQPAVVQRADFAVTGRRIFVEVMLILLVIVFIILVQQYHNLGVMLAPGLYWILHNFLVPESSLPPAQIPIRAPSPRDHIEEYKQDEGDSKEDMEEFFQTPQGLDSKEWHVFNHELNFTFPYPWEVVVDQMWKRFPDPLKPEIDAKIVWSKPGRVSGTTIRQREFSMPNKAPGMLKSFFGNQEIVHLDETSIEYAEHRKLVLHAENREFRNVAMTLSISEYTEHPDNRNWTMLTQIMGIKTGRSVSLVKGKIRSFGESSFKEESELAAERLLQLLNERHKMNFRE